MSTKVFLDQVVYHVTADSESIRHLDGYQKVRDEINARFNPLSGGTNWREVYHACEKLAKGPGVDLLMSSYLTVAKLKVEGLAGYANGLELLMQCLSLLPKPDTKSAKKRREVLEWSNRKVLPELKKMKPSSEQLRDLYRCEKLCDRMHEWILRQQPEVAVDFEGVGFTLFEHIDQIETRYHTIIRQQENRPEYQGRITRQCFRRSLLASCLISSLLGATSLWLYNYHAANNQGSFKQLTAQPALTVANVDAYIERTKAANLIKVQSELVPLYQTSIETKTNASLEQPYLTAIEQLEVLQKLFAKDKQVEQIGQRLNLDKSAALEQADQLVAQFKQLRARLANVAVLAKKHRWSQVARESQSLEELALELSPIYGRLDYIETLLESEQNQQAEQEFESLKQRLNNLSWKVAQLEIMFNQ